MSRWGVAKVSSAALRLNSVSAEGVGGGSYPDKEGLQQAQHMATSERVDHNKHDDTQQNDDNRCLLDAVCSGDPFGCWLGLAVLALCLYTVCGGRAQE